MQKFCPSSGALYYAMQLVVWYTQWVVGRWSGNGGNSLPDHRPIQEQKVWYFILLGEILEIVKTEVIIAFYFRCLGLVCVVFYLNEGNTWMWGAGVAKDVCSVKLQTVTCDEVKKFICQQIWTETWEYQRIPQATPEIVFNIIDYNQMLYKMQLAHIFTIHFCT